MRNYALDTKLLPKVWVTWASTKSREFHKRYWLNCQTGKKKDKPESWMLYDSESDINRYSYRGEDNRVRMGCYWYTEDKPQIWVNSGSSVKFAYIKYHPDIDRLEVAAVEMDTSRKDEPRSWKFAGNRYFIGKDKTIIDQYGTRVYQRYNLYKYHTAWSGNELLGMLIRLHIPSGFLAEFKKFVGGGYFTIGNGSTVTITSPWQLQQWYMTVQKERTNGKQQKLTDALTEIPLSDITGLEYIYPVKKEQESDYYTHELKDIVYFEEVNKDLCVLRALLRNDNHFKEVWRMYIGNDGLSRIVSKSENGWVPSKQVRDWRQKLYLANTKEAIEKCPRIKYVLGSVENIPEYNLVNFLITALRFPEIEQLAKLGYTYNCLNIVGSYTPKADLKSLFGDYYNDKEKNLLRKVGLTKEQLDHHLRSSGYDNLSYLDTQSFVKYYKGCEKVRSHFWRGLSYYTDTLNLDEMKFFKNICRLSEKAENAWTMVNDTIDSYTRLNAGTAPEIDWYFESMSDLVRAHDGVTELHRMQEAERRARWNMAEAERLKEEEKKRIKLDKERKIYEYEDDNYIIRLPKDGAEIIREGNVQRICIGGYVSRHSTGGTNLFFLREKNNESTPFYAIEMNNFKSIVQIHGYCNKWLGNNPEAIPTVIRWLRKNGITCSDKILTCKSTGYGSVNDYVPMPVVD